MAHDHVIGKRPAHTHNGPKTGKWECNSPYCEELEVDAPEDGGPPVIMQGQEPWRGR